MVTRKDLDILDAIQNKIRETKNLQVNIPASLCLDDFRFYKAISSIRNAGLISMLSCFTCYMTILLSQLYITIVGEQAMDNFTLIFGFVFLGIVLGLFGFMSYKIYNLSVAPRTLLIFLIIALIANLLMSITVAPIVGVICSLVALIRWDVYRIWYSEVSEKALNADSAEQALYKINRGPVILFAILSLLMLVIFSFVFGVALYSSKSTEMQNEAYESGYTNGFVRGRSDEYGEKQSSYRNGYNSGYQDGSMCALDIAADILQHGATAKDINSCKKY